MRRAAETLHDAVTRTGFVASAAALGGIVVLYCYEVFARYFFSSPTTWSSDMVGYLLGAAVFLAMPYVTQRADHVAIDFLQTWIRSDLVKARISRTIWGAAFAVCVFATALNAGETWRQFQDDITTMSATAIPQWWISIFIAYGFGSSSLYFLRYFLGGRPVTEDDGTSGGVA